MISEVEKKNIYKSVIVGPETGVLFRSFSVWTIYTLWCLAALI